VSTFVYAPQIRAYISPRSGPRAGEYLDISDDLVSGVVNIRTNGIHTFSFQLQNVQRKYDSIIQPMDRITVEMKRVEWVRVFSGYLNNGPIFSVWPRVLNITASCSLKRLQFWYWDSTTSKSAAILNTINLGNTTTVAGGGAAAGAGAGAAVGAPGATVVSPVAVDEGLRKTIVKLLVEVVGWPQEKIHIGEVPANWYAFADAIEKQIVTDNDVSSLFGAFRTTATVGGTQVGGMANGTLSAGTYGNTAINAEQANNAAIIYNVAAGRGLSPKAAIIAIATALQESTLRNLNYGDRDSLGLFQQRPSAGWGTPAQVTDPVYASNKFYDALVAVPGWEGLPVTVAAQRVQRSAFPDAYAKWEDEATAMVATLSSSPGGQGSSGAAAGASAGAVGAAPSGAPPLGSGRNVALVAHNVIASKPPGYIRYSMGGDDPYTNPDPKVLDCSSLVDWVYYNAVGRPIQPGRTTTYFQQPWVQHMSVENAKYVKGALLFVGSPAHHVEISLGNGNTAGAHTDGVPLAQQVTIGPAGNGWTDAGLMPGVDYRDAATNAAAAAEVSRIIAQPTTISDPNESGTGTTGGGGSAATMVDTDGGAFEKFVNVYVWGLTPNTTGDVLVGARAMMNDEPILPYVANLMSACMRSWCSAPNGDLMAWFPDYFGIWNSAAAMDVRSIELMDFTVDWYDQEIVTHQYVVGTPMTYLDPTTANTSGQSSGSQFGWSLASQGIATMDYPQIFQAVFGESASEQFVKDYLDRFGGRPNVVNIPIIRQGAPEFFMALYLFMQRWANQFRASVPMTFMPELWPGMLLRLPEFGFQAYINEVQHTFQFGPGGGFRTQAQIIAPSRTSGSKTDILGMLPLGGPR
jgi:cell wall-associated NlpC family hydrolase